MMFLVSLFVIIIIVIVILTFKCIFQYMIKLIMMKNDDKMMKTIIFRLMVFEWHYHLLFQIKMQCRLKISSIFWNSLNWNSATKIFSIPIDCDAAKVFVKVESVAISKATNRQSFSLQQLKVERLFAFGRKWSWFFNFFLLQHKNNSC